MGQRLNIEIKKDSKVLANAYYHWSAYTSSALQMLGGILSGIDEVESSSDIELAVRLLELTGAGVTGRERDLIQKSSLNNVINFAIQPAVDRNEGLLAVTEEGIQETREWEEGRVTVDIGTRTFSFNVLWEEDEETFRADYSDEEYEELDWVESGLDIYDVPFERYDKFKELIDSHKRGVVLPDGCVLLWIE